MRRKHFTSHIKLSIIVTLISTSFCIYAKSKDEVTDIICFAAQSKWVCAPADQQELANKKAQNLLKNNQKNSESSEVIIKSINIPKFSSIDTDSETKANNLNITKTANNKSARPNNIKPLTNNTNPYAKLWSHQLIGLSTPNSAIKFVKNNNLDKNEVLIIQSVRANMDWWIVLYGLYNDKQTGLENESNLPSNISNAWLRPLKNLKVNGFIDKF